MAEAMKLRMFAATCRHLGAVLLPLLICAAGGALADPPAGYYDSVDYTSTATIRATLHDVIDGHTKIPYTATSTDTWNVLELADEDPNDAVRILDVYLNASYPKYGAGNNDYNREHTWPKSYGFPDDGSTNLPYSDCHMLFLCNDSYNTSRNNNIYDNCNSGCVAYPTQDYNGESGVNYREGSYSWETWSGRRGDVARAQFYADLRYEGDAGSEPDLVLTDNTALIVVTGTNASLAYMGKLATLIQWHYDDPVDDRERRRNDVVHIYQGNRNPFIDHPEFVAYLFQGVVAPVDDDLPGTAREGAGIASIHPNPFNPSTTVAFTLDRSGPVRIEVFAVDGRRVRTLLDANREAGRFEVPWNGLSDAGLRAPSGTYYFRLVSGGLRDTRPAVLLK